MQENYLAKWLNNELSEAELSEFKKSDEYASYMRIVEASKKIEPPKFDVDQAWNTFKATQMGQVPKVVPLRPFKQFLRIAAVVAVMMVGSYFYLNSLNETFTTDLAERTEVTLPDTSKVILNADSEITFSEKKWDENRRITLKGEAFFKVAKGEKFTVATENGVVTVLGTQFNIENRNGFFEVSCYEGLVRVSYKGSEQKLHAGSSMVAINGKIMNDKGLTALQPAWMNNESSFKSIPLKYVLAEFERQYDVEVKTKNIDTEQLFTGTFSNTDINLALKSISTPSQIRFTLEDDNVLFYAEKTP
jgi:ferric-dicitrate binding protein FerR (iron transport regulator)